MESKRRIVRVLPVFAAIILVFAMSVSILGDNIRDLQQRRQGVQENIRELQGLLADAQAERDYTLAEILQMEIEMATAAGAHEEALSNLAHVTAQLAAAEDDLAVAEELRIAQLDTLRGRIRFMHENSSMSYIELLLASDTISDFLSNMEHISRIIERDNNILGNLQETEERIARSRDAIAYNLVEVIYMTAALEATMENLDAMLDVRNARMEELELQAELNRNQIAQYQQEEAGLNRDIVNAQAAAAAAARAAQRATTHTHSVTQSANALFVWPVDGPRMITSGYGWRRRPFGSGDEFHSGLDMRAPFNTPILAAADGTVIFSAWHNGGWGNKVIIDHGGGLHTWYAHNSRNVVSVGQQVVAGERIALAGSTGRSTGPHLHFEVRLNGTSTTPGRTQVDPAPYLGLTPAR